MTESEALCRLQEIDLELARIGREGRELPQHARIAAADAARKKVGTELRKIVGRRKDLETEIDDLAHKRRDVVRLIDEASAKSQETAGGYRAAADLESRMAMLAKRLEKVDFDSDAVTDQLVTAERAEKNALAVQRLLDDEKAALTASAREAIAELKRRAADLQREREQVVVEVSPEAQLRYINAQKRFGSRAVEVLEGRKPSCCRIELQPSQYDDLVRRARPIDECPYCHRILVTKF